MKSQGNSKGALCKGPRAEKNLVSLKYSQMWPEIIVAQTRRQDRRWHEVTTQFSE